MGLEFRPTLQGFPALPDSIGRQMTQREDIAEKRPSFPTALVIDLQVVSTREDA